MNKNSQKEILENLKIKYLNKKKMFLSRDYFSIAAVVTFTKEATYLGFVNIA